MARVGDSNAFGLVVTRVQGRMVDLRCPVCGQTGSAPQDEFSSTRCGSVRCGGSEGRTD